MWKTIVHQSQFSRFFRLTLQMAESRETTVKPSVAAVKVASSRRLRILDEEDDDPILSSINLVDVFLVALGILMVSQMDRERHYDAADHVQNRQVNVKDGERIPRFRASGASAEGNGVRAGMAYRLEDGTLIYVPSEESPR